MMNMKKLGVLLAGSAILVVVCGIPQSVRSEGVADEAYGYEFEIEIDCAGRLAEGIAIGLADFGDCLDDCAFGLCGCHHKFFEWLDWILDDYYQCTEYYGLSTSERASVHTEESPGVRRANGTPVAPAPLARVRSDSAAPTAAFEEDLPRLLLLRTQLGPVSVAVDEAVRAGIFDQADADELASIMLSMTDPADWDAIQDGVILEYISLAGRQVVLEVIIDRAHDVEGASEILLHAFVDSLGDRLELPAESTQRLRDLTIQAFGSQVESDRLLELAVILLSDEGASASTDFDYHKCIAECTARYKEGSLGWFGWHACRLGCFALAVLDGLGKILKPLGDILDPLGLDALGDIVAFQSK